MEKLKWRYNMKGIKKLILLACITVGILSSFALVSAKDGQVTFKDVHLKFDTWKGTGDASISLGDDSLTKDLNVVEANQFIQLKLGENTVQDSEYTITGEGKTVLLSLKESYLKKLQDGYYDYKVEFKKVIIPVRLYVVTSKTETKDLYYSFNKLKGTGEAKLTLTGKKYQVDLFENLIYKGDIINKNNYTILNNGNQFIIKLKEKFVKKLQLGTNYFTLDFSNIRVGAKINIAPGKVKNLRFKIKNKKLKVTWSKQKNVRGYIIKLSKNKKFNKKVKTYKVVGNHNYKVLKTKYKNYYFKIRAYTKENGKMIYGEWSNRARNK